MIYKSENKWGLVITFSTKIFLFFLFSLLSIKGKAQLGNSFDIGIHIGALSVQSDYGQRGEIRSSMTGNIGFASSLAFYKNFYNRNSSWNDRASWLEDHIKLKAEVSYYKATLNHYGDYTEGLSNGAALLRAMHGTSSVVNFGGVLEHHFLRLTEYTGYSSDRYFSPFISLGGMIGISKASVTSDLGDYTSNPELLIAAYRENAIYTEQLTVGSLLFGVGTRVKMGDNFDLVIDTRWQSYLSDKIDGLKPRLSVNKHLDWTYSMSLGLVIGL